MERKLKHIGRFTVCSVDETFDLLHEVSRGPSWRFHMIKDTECLIG